MENHTPGDTSCFADASFPLLDVQPTWRQHRAQTASKAVSTDPVAQQDAEVQSTDRSNAAVQATAGAAPQGSAGKARLDAASLAGFLQSVAPLVLAELSANLDSSLDTAAHNSRQSQGNAQDDPECLFTLSAFSDGSSSAALSRANKHQLQVTGLSWSKTGQTLAASFGRYEASGWCVLPGAVATWNLSRPGLDGSSPDRFIATDSCIMCLAFHPAEPALLAAGTYNGQVAVFDLARDDAAALLAQTDLLADVRHREPVTAVSWQYSAQECRRHGSPASSYRLFSLGADGRLLVWRWKQLANPVYGYELRWAWAGPGGGTDTRVCLGGSCMAFCPAGSSQEEAGLCLVGTEGGRLLRCQVNDLNDASLREFGARLDASAAAAAAGGSSKVELRSAARTTHYEPMAATVNDLAACPHQRQLAVAAGGDGTLRVLDVLRSAPLLLLEPAAAPLLSAGWSPSRPLVVAAGAADGSVHLYDLAARQRLIRPVAQLHVAAASSSSSSSSRQSPQRQRHSAVTTSNSLGSGVNALAFNSVVPSTLAAAAGDQIKVWRLPGWLVEPRPGEAKLLKRLLESDDVLGLLRRQALCVG